jgi:hypothetical protein
MGAPRAGADRSGSVFIIEYDGHANVKPVLSMNGKMSKRVSMFTLPVPEGSFAVVSQQKNGCL